MRRTAWLPWSDPSLVAGDCRRPQMIKRLMNQTITCSTPQGQEAHVHRGGDADHPIRLPTVPVMSRPEPPSTEGDRGTTEKSRREEHRTRPVLGWSA